MCPKLLCKESESWVGKARLGVGAKSVEEKQQEESRAAKEYQVIPTLKAPTRNFTVNVSANSFICPSTRRLDFFSVFSFLTPTKNCRVVHFFTFITIYLANFLFARAARTCLPGSKKANKKGEIENTKLHFILGKISGILQSLFS